MTFSLCLKSKIFMAVTDRCFAFHHSSFNHSLLKHHENISYKCEDKHTDSKHSQK
jgi:hypothetical protein